jgi:small subunit ribosomal protein S16
MAVRLRLKRMGAKKKLYYVLWLLIPRSPRDGKSIEDLGTYNPLNGEINVDEPK